jgi:hypothetical protein
MKNGTTVPSTFRAYLLTSSGASLPHCRPFSSLIQARAEVEKEIQKRADRGETVGGKVIELGAAILEVWRRNPGENKAKEENFEERAMKVKPPKAEWEMFKKQPMPKSSWME